METKYILVHPVTRERLPYPNVFSSATAATMFALIHDIKADVETVRDKNQPELALTWN
ncbi:MAG TPA: hypothetical protein VLK33_05185 [Terriglobales bacterium]|nr:hypothetical protein [Terriglobales bacterium]